MNICEKYFIPNDLTEEEAIQWAKEQAILKFKSGRFEFIHEEDLIGLLENIIVAKNKKSKKYEGINYFLNV